MKEVLKALKRNEVVHIFYHGKKAGTIVPPKRRKRMKISEHPFYGSATPESMKETVEEKMDRLRGLRYRDL
jgi:hypothetical protein